MRPQVPRLRVIKSFSNDKTPSKLIHPFQLLPVSPRTHSRESYIGVYPNGFGPTGFGPSEFGKEGQHFFAQLKKKKS